jgi:hypothetical protein
MKKKSKKLLKTCSLCGNKPVFSWRSIYCRECSHFCARMSNVRISPEVREQLKEYVRKNKGFYCYYTKMKLNVFKKSDPYFLEFDHLVPGDPSKMVITSAWFNELKGDLAIKELKRSVRQLFNFWTKGIKIKKSTLRYWYRIIRKISRK